MTNSTVSQSFLDDLEFCTKGHSLRLENSVSLRAVKTLFTKLHNIHATMPCFQFYLCTHVHCQLYKKLKKTQTTHFQGAQGADHYNESPACSPNSLSEVGAK